MLKNIKSDQQIFDGIILFRTFTQGWTIFSEPLFMPNHILSGTQEELYNTNFINGSTIHMDL